MTEIIDRYFEEREMATIIPSELSAKEKEFRERLGSNIKLVIKTGKLKLGFRNVIRELQRGNAKMVIIATNMPEERRALLTYLCAIANVPLAVFPGTVKELGEVCGRPHIISSIVILDPGTSEILKLGEVPTL